MKNTLKSLQALSVLAIAAISTQSAWAHQWTPRVEILGLEAGWSAEHLTVRLKEPFTTNPSGCSQWGLYLVTADDPGQKLFNELLQKAYFSGHTVQLLIQGDGVCPFDKPKIIDVSVRR
jgi:hypothetical protein